MQPRWSASLPAYIRLSTSQVERLEIIRRAVGVSFEEFEMHIRSHPECTKMLQRQQFELAVALLPSADASLQLSVVILQRLATARLVGGDIFDLRKRFSDSIDIEDSRLLRAVLDLLVEKRWSNIDDVAAGIVEYEARLEGVVQPDASTLEARRQIELILRERPPV